MTLVSALLVLMLLSILTMAFLRLGASEPVIANNLLMGSQAFWLAESALEISLVRLNAGEPVDADRMPLGAGTYSATVTEIHPDEVRVVGVGRVGSAKRVVSNVMKVEEGVWRPMRQFREEE